MDLLKKALSNDVVAAYWADVQRLFDLGLPPAVSSRILACLFGYSTSFVGAMGRRPERHYRSFTIKKGKKHRLIHAPRVGLKVIQKWLSFHLGKVIVVDDAVFGFVTGRSAYLAAVQHCGAKWVYSVDIKDFFPSTSIEMVSDALERIGYPRHSADLISRLNSHRGMLAQGSPASPVLSNLVFGPCDSMLKAIATESAVRYTRYADDIVFSGTEAVPPHLAERVRTIITEAGWQVSEHKDRLSELPHRLKVHGLLVHGTYPRLTKGYRNKLRAIKHLVDANLVRPDDLTKFYGHLSYAMSIRTIEEDQNPGGKHLRLSQQRLDITPSNSGKPRAGHSIHIANEEEEAASGETN